MSDYIDRNHAIAALSFLEVKNPNANLRDARRAIADTPEPGRMGKLRYALEVIRNECRSHNESCWGCPLCIVEGVGTYCTLEKMIREVNNDTN